MLREQLIEKLIGDKPEKTAYQRLIDNEFNSLPYKLFFDILKIACAQETVRIAAAKKRDGGQQDEKDENSAGCPGQNCGLASGTTKQK